MQLLDTSTRRWTAGSGMKSKVVARGHGVWDLGV